MAAKKETAAPTRRSTRVASLGSAAPAVTETKKTAEKRKEVDADKLSAKKAKQAKTKTDAKLKVGDQLPDITLKDEEGNEANVLDIVKDKGMVLFAYPKASTPGCTKQVLLPIDGC
jgi:thioredoxin-dependent peroxiredoxin